MAAAYPKLTGYSVVTNSHHCPPVAVAASNVTAINTRVRHVITRDCDSIRVFYTNAIYATGTAPGNIKVRASVQKARADERSAAGWPVQFPNTTAAVRQLVHFDNEDTNRDVTLAYRGEALSLPVQGPFFKGDVIWVNTRVVPVTPATDRIPVAGNNILASTGSLAGFSPHNTCERCEVVTAGTPDYTDNTASWAALGLTDAAGYVPTAIVGDTGSPAPSWIIWGDSIAQGTGDDSNSGLEPVDSSIGYVNRALTGVLPYVNLAVGGTSPNSYLPDGAITALGNDMFRLAGLGTHAFVQIGTNMVNSLFGSQTMEQRKEWFRFLFAKLRAQGIQSIVVANMLPKSTASVWATADDRNQWVDTAVSAGSGVSYADMLTQLNQWLSSQCDGLVEGYVDLGSTVGRLGEAWSGGVGTAPLAAGRYIWQSGMTADGIHPNRPAHQRMADRLQEELPKWDNFS